MIGRIAPGRGRRRRRGRSPASVRRTDFIPDLETGGITVARGRRPSCSRRSAARVADGRNLDAAMERYPTVVLGSVAASRLGIAGRRRRRHGRHRRPLVRGRRHPRVRCRSRPEIDRSALIGLPVAKELFGATGSPTTIYVRAADAAIDDVRSVLPATANPANPEEVEVSRPSEAIAAKAAAATTFTALFLGLGAVALLVGGLGIANVMLMAVLERRSEIGLRRALGATRGHIVGQFLAEALLLAGVGGVAGVS